MGLNLLPGLPLALPCLASLGLDLYSQSLPSLTQQGVPKAKV